MPAPGGPTRAMAASITMPVNDSAAPARVDLHRPEPPGQHGEEQHHPEGGVDGEPVDADRRRGQADADRGDDADIDVRRDADASWGRRPGWGASVVIGQGSADRQLPGAAGPRWRASALSAGAAWAVAGTSRATAARAATASDGTELAHGEFPFRGGTGPWTAGPDASSLARGTCVRQSLRATCVSTHHRHTVPDERHPMSKRARKRRSRKGNKANHGRKPNA